MKLFLALITVIIASLPSYAADRCAPIKQSTLPLPSDQLFARKYFIDRAKQLNDSGRCVMGGGYDNQKRVFYYKVNDTDNPNEITILQFTFQELSNRRINM